MGWMSICEKEIKFAGKCFFFFFLAGHVLSLSWPLFA
jgi:hypothetical protein